MAEVKTEHIGTIGIESEEKHADPLLAKTNVLPAARGGNGSMHNPQHALMKFQTIVGIRTPGDIAGDVIDPRDISKPSKRASKFHRPAENIGIYQRVIYLQKNRRTAFLVITWVINCCLLAQLVLAAIITALGASEAPHNVITIFGAINVAIAGLLAFYKGQGLPDRLRQDWIGLSRVRDYIEERERLLQAAVILDPDLEHGGVPAGKAEDLMAELKTVLTMYNQQISTMEDNRPDTYVPSPTAGTSSAPKEKK